MVYYGTLTKKRSSKQVSRLVNFLMYFVSFFVSTLLFDLHYVAVKVEKDVLLGNM